MTGRIADYPTRIYVHSESEPDVEYLVDLTAFPRYQEGIGPDARVVYNGSCGRSDMGVIGCRNFLFKCEPRLKEPENVGKIYRCKHIRWARENCLDFILPKMKEMDPNIPEEHQV